MTIINLSPSTICVFCASSSDVSREIFQSGKAVAGLLAKAGLDLIYGGTTCGLMLAVAESFKTAGGKVIGVVPRFMKGIINPLLDETIGVETMSKRKEKMNEISGGFLVLPGGIGTMDEFFDTLAQKQLGMHNKPIILLNTSDYYLHLKNFFDNAVTHNTVKPEYLKLFHFAQSPEEVIRLLA